MQDGTQFGDLPEFCDFAFNARVARVNGVALWSLAQAPGTPKGLTMDNSVLTNNSTLKWTGDPAAVGYEVVWRASEDAFWTHVVPVGKVTSTTSKWYDVPSMAFAVFLLYGTMRAISCRYIEP